MGPHSLWQSALRPRRVGRFGFGSSFARLVAFRFREMRRREAAAAAFCAGKVAAHEAKPDVLSAQLRTHLRRSGPRDASRPLPIPHRSARGQPRVGLGEEAAKKNSVRERRPARPVISIACARIVAHSPAANNAAAPLRAQQGPRTQVTQQPSQRKVRRTPSRRDKDDPADRHGPRGRRRL